MLLGVQTSPLAKTGLERDARICIAKGASELIESDASQQIFSERDHEPLPRSEDLVDGRPRDARALGHVLETFILDRNPREPLPRDIENPLPRFERRFSAH